MAEVSSASQGVPGKKFSRSTRVDLTPMVDLGFLLITFFVFTTTMASPKAVRLTIPDDSPTADPTRAPASKTLTLLLGERNTIFYYNGFLRNSLNQTTYASGGLRHVIQEAKTKISKTSGDGNELTVIIKPLKELSFKNVINALDELLINDVSKYAIVDVEPAEEALVMRIK